MKAVLFDLGGTLEEQTVLLPGALEMLQAVSRLVDQDGEPLELALVSDFGLAGSPADADRLRLEYIELLQQLGLLSSFLPESRRITLSSDVGVYKPDVRVFRHALDRLSPGLQFDDTIFLTENGSHVQAARALGMRAVHFKGPSGAPGAIDALSEFAAIVRGFAGGPGVPC